MMTLLVINDLVCTHYQEGEMIDGIVLRFGRCGSDVGWGVRVFGTAVTS